jgi:hypothetical protein
MISGDCWNDNSRLLGRLHDLCGALSGDLQGTWPLLEWCVATLWMVIEDSWGDNAILRRRRLLGWWVMTVEISKLRNGRDEYGSSCVAEFRVLSPCSPRGTVPKKPMNHVTVPRPRLEDDSSVTDWTKCTEITFCNVAVGNNVGDNVGLHPKLTPSATSAWTQYLINYNKRLRKIA